MLQLQGRSFKDDRGVRNRYVEEALERERRSWAFSPTSKDKQCLYLSIARETTAVVS